MDAAGSAAAGGGDAATQAAAGGDLAADSGANGDISFTDEAAGAAYPGATTADASAAVASAGAAGEATPPSTLAALNQAIINAGSAAWVQYIGPQFDQWVVSSRILGLRVGFQSCPKALNQWVLSSTAPSWQPTAAGVF